MKAAVGPGSSGLPRERAQILPSRSGFPMFKLSAAAAAAFENAWPFHTAALNPAASRLSGRLPRSGVQALSHMQCVE